MRQLVLLAVMVWAPLAGAQIVIPAKVQLGEPIEATTPFEARNYQWESDASLRVYENGRGAFVWARPGKHTITLIAVTESYEIRKWSTIFEVIDSPVPPQPVTLRELVDDSTAKVLADYFEGISRQVSLTTTPEKFWPAFDKTMPVPGYDHESPIGIALKLRLTEALKDPSTLAAALRQIASEFRSIEQPPAPETVPAPVVEKPTSVTYVYEKNEGAVPPAVLSALDRVNREIGIRATDFEVSTVDGEGQIPDQYKAAKIAAENAGLPALVIMVGDRPKSVIVDPRTFEQVWEAVVQ